MMAQWLNGQQILTFHLMHLATFQAMNHWTQYVFHRVSCKNHLMRAVSTMAHRQVAWAMHRWNDIWQQTRLVCYARVRLQKLRASQTLNCWANAASEQRKERVAAHKQLEVATLDSEMVQAVEHMHHSWAAFKNNINFRLYHCFLKCVSVWSTGARREIVKRAGNVREN